MATPRLNTSWIGQTVGGRYKIEATLGQGGMSSVYQATDPNLRRTVAIKLIHPHLSSDPEFVRRFEQEAAAVAQLRHPNIIQVYDFNHDDELYFMVLEFVPGETLQSRLASLDAAKQRLPLSDSISIMSTVAEAVAYAHSRGMIHRDLKPANVMLTPSGQPILMDFGVAKMLGGTQHTATGAIVGTAKYMSPEQARGDRPDERTDIYSLGVMLYELVAGQPPFDADTTVAVLMKHVTEPVPDIRQIRSDIPDELVAIIQKALQKKPEDRYQSASELAAALRAVTAQDQRATVVADDLDSTQLVSTGTRRSATSVPVAAAPKPSPAATPASTSGGRSMWMIGAAVVGLLLLAAVGAFFIFSGSSTSTTGSAEPTAVAVAVNQNLPPATGMVRINGGNYTVGLDPADSEHAPAQRVDLADFWIDRYEVTNGQYADFLAATGAAAPADWPDGAIPADQANHPVKGVTWAQAVAFCEWANKRLPTEAEWEVAARGADSRLYPWGDDPRAVELPRNGTYEVGGKPTNQTPSGVFDLAGNVWEWVGEPYAPVESGQRVLRGGANGFIKDMAYRLPGDPTVPTMVATAGIRCAASQVDESNLAKIQLAEGVLYQDTFADPGSGWPVLAENARFFGYHPPDFYHIELSQPDSQTAITRPPNFDDITVESQVRVDTTDTDTGNYRYGLVLRRVNETDYYAFVISNRSGMWQVLKSSPAGREVLVEGAAETLKGFAPKGFTPDQSDSLRVDASGPNFAFHVNDEVVAQVSDSDYASGETGFYVETFDETLAHIHYDALTIRELEAEAIVAAPTEAPAPTAVAATETPTSEPEPTEPAEPTATAVSDTLPTQEATAEASPTPSATPTEELLPTPTNTSVPTNTPRPTDTPAPPTATPVSAPAGMVLIPAGSFTMGSTTGQADEAPSHQVSLAAYLIDKFEVSNADYRRCVAEGGCTQTKSADGFTRPGYRDSPDFNNYPVVNVTWDQAGAYCRWAGKRLPTEAEWEYAARGADNLTWPWGNSFNASLSAAGSPDTEPVNSFPGGASPFGVFNMAGNVNEWVQDVYSTNFYATSPAENPVNNSGGNLRVFRGGSFANPDGAFYTTTRRYNREPAFSDVDMGFRCAMDGQ